MPLTVVNDLVTLQIFLDEIGTLWSIASDKLHHAKDRYEWQLHRDECRMYSDIISVVIKEAEVLV